MKITILDEDGAHVFDSVGVCLETRSGEQITIMEPTRTTSASIKKPEDFLDEGFVIQALGDLWFKLPALSCNTVVLRIEKSELRRAMERRIT